MTEALVHEPSCGVYWLGPGGGYCGQGGGRTEWHHVVLRSEPEPDCQDCGGVGAAYAPDGSTPGCPTCKGTGKLPRETEFICTYCHKHTHREYEPYLYRMTLPSSEYVYVEAPSKGDLAAVMSDMPDDWDDQQVITMLLSRTMPEAMWEGSAPIHWRVARLRRNCDEEIRAKAEELEGEVRVSLEIFRTGASRLATALWEMEQMGDGWRLLGYSTKAEFAEELGYAPRTINAYLAAERLLYENAAILPEQREALRGFSMELRVSARKALSGMTTEQVQEVIERAEVAPVKDVISYAKTMDGMNTARRLGKGYAEVTLVARAATFVMEVPYTEGQDPVEKAKRSIQFRPYIHIVDWAPDEQQGWEEVER